MDDEWENHIDPEEFVKKGLSPCKYRPIICLLMVEKILTALIKEIALTE